MKATKTSKKKKKIVIMILAGLIALILLFSVIVVRRNRVPEGFSQSQNPIISTATNSQQVIFNFRHQFPEINSHEEGDYMTQRFFKYNEQLHYVIVPSLGWWSTYEHIFDMQWARSNQFLVYRDCNNQSLYLGSLVSTMPHNRRIFSREIIFLDVHYIYYQLLETRSIGRFFRFNEVYYIWDWLALGHNTRSFSKYTFFRFDLNTGNNEEVELEHFFTRLIVHNPYVKLNPNF